MTDRQRPEGRRRRRLRGGLRLGLLVGLFALVFWLVEQLVPGAGRRLSRADLWWLAGAVGLEVAACVSYAALFHAVFSRAPWVLRVRRSGEIGLAELGAFAVLPTGLGGPAVRFWALRAAEMPWRTIVVRTVAHFALFNLPYVAAAIVLGLGVSLDLLPGHAPLLTALAPLGLVAVSVVLVGLAAWVSRLERPGEARWRRRVREWSGTVPEGVRDLLSCVRRPGGPAGALGWWAGDCAALWAGFQAVGGHPPLSVLILAYMLGQLGATLPLPGGVGGVEPLMLGIFAASGVNLGVAGAAIICYRTISLGTQGALGAGAFTSLTTALGTRPEARRGTLRE